MRGLDSKRVMETGAAILAATAVAEIIRWLYRRRQGGAQS